MTSTTPPRTTSDGRSTYVVTAAVALLWLVTAFLRPGTTMHLGPLLVPLIPTLVSGRSETSVETTAFAAIAATGVVGVLLLSAHLDGPAVRPFSSAILESIAFLAIGIGVGLYASVVIRRR